MIRSFDIRTAFLRGSRQDDRVLGKEPPEELRAKMKLQPNEVCELLKGAYGPVNAPLLWYLELKGMFLSLDFQISPLDPCVFVLPKKQADANDCCQIHGILGIHVDDGLGGGDSVFNEVIDRLEARFPFGNKRQREFIFTGVHVEQETNGDILLDQIDYVNDVKPIDIPRERRAELSAKATDLEVQELRGLIGSLQYAATHTRPDLSCRLSLLQAKVTTATVGDLQQGSKLLQDAKNHNNVKIRIQSLPTKDVRFMTFSDAAFATRAKAHSQKECSILATTPEIEHQGMAKVNPLIWFSKKIAHVVASTLASETYALSGALDLLSWTRLHWSWMLNPQIKW